jgi:hypothetical protein
MTDNLVKQLRAARESGDPWAAWHLALQTADRIEKLEAALREIAALGFWDGDSAMNIARKALEETK